MRKFARYFWVLFILACGAALFFSNRIAILYTDWLWHQSLGTGIVFRRIYSTRLLLFGVFGIASFLLAYGNVYLADRIAPPGQVSLSNALVLFTNARPLPLGRFLRALTSFRHILDRLLVLGAIIFALFAGLGAQSEWDSFLRFSHPASFGRVDPQFGRDLGFYVFSLPFWLFVQGWLFTVLLLISVGVAVVYSYQKSIDRASGSTVVLPYVRGHLSILLALLLIAWAWGCYLNRYALLFQNGAFPGAGYVDIHSRLPLLNLQTGLCLIGAAACLLNAWWRTLFLPILAAIVWAGGVLLSFLLPTLMYHVQVLPTEATTEAPYIKRAIQFTRFAYGLDALQEKVLPLRTTMPDFTTNSGRFLSRNLFIEDEDPLLRQWMRSLSARPYYTFSSVDLDRYSWKGESHLVALAPRELNRAGMDPRAMTWPNLRLRYTHGYGTAFWAADRSSGIIDTLQKSLTTPALYNDTRSRWDEFIIVQTRQTEIGFPETTGTPPTARYEGRDGVRLNWFRRLAFALRFASPSLAVSREILPESRVIFSQQVAVRVQRMLPSLLLDNDLYPVILNGRIVYVQQAYTTASTLPYAAPRIGRDFLQPTVPLNYIRPAVLATVDAYEGTVRLYVMTPDDPLICSYQRIFPGLFLPASAMPPELRQHLRYPRDYFLLQRGILTDYHTNNAAAFYSRTNPLIVPRLGISPEIVRLPFPPPLPDQIPDMLPGYGFILPPDTLTPRFALVSPYVHSDREHLAALLVGGCDSEDYGTLQLYRIPPAVAFPGPEAMDRQLQQLAEVGRLRTEANERGAQLLFGATRLIFAGDTIAYARPLYRRYRSGSATSIPTRQQVALLNPGQIVLAPTWEGVLEELETTTRPDTSTVLPDALRRLIDQATLSFQRGQAALRNGDFAAYGKENAALGAALRRLQRAIPEKEAGER